MKKLRIVFLTIGLLLIISPYFINVYSIYKLIAVLLGIIFIDIYFALSKKINIFLLVYLPIILLLLTYSIDYFKTYTFSSSPIYVWQNKINNDITIYNSLFYRIYKCQNTYTFDNDYHLNFVCDTNLLSNQDVNHLLSDIENTYKTYHNDFIKVTGKISKISGTSSVELSEYTVSDNALNGYVKFNDNYKLKVLLNGLDISNYKIYDYITVVGLLATYKDGILTLKDIKIEDNNLYNNYNMEVIEDKVCQNELKEYSNNLYTLCIQNIYLDYKVDKYELSYALKDGKITFDDLIQNQIVEEENNIKVYILDKLKIMKCSNNKNILLSNNEKVLYSLCED